VDLDFTPDDLAFQAEARAFVTEHFPPGRAYEQSRDRKRWAAALHARGWAAYRWPVEHGGPPWTATQRFIWERETTSRGVPPVLGGMGMGMLAPVLMGYGTPEQRARHLPGILDDSVEWCQGYSEPGSGSDLASLRTRAVREGDQYVIDGEKVWTSWAHIAKWMFGLVRTSDEARKQQGITFLLIDMTTPGIEVSPIVTIDGLHTLNRVTFTGVRVPVENRVGEEGQGWTVAKGLLTHERTGLAFVSESLRLLGLLREVSARLDGDFAQRLAQTEVELRALEITELRTLAEAEAGASTGAQSSILKLKGTEIIQRVTELFTEAAGVYAAPWTPIPEGGNAHPIGPDWAFTEVQRYFSGRAASIAGGSDEVQRNIIAKSVLGL
jgi:alkylation response protein AidB-like acyl-CoA dehydrogenase